MSNNAATNRALGIFERELALFSGFFDVRNISVRVTPEHFDKNCVYRDMAWAEVSRDANLNLISGRVFLMKKILSLTEDNMVAVIRHEISHCVDPFVGRSGAEQRADDIAFLVCGDKIRYDMNLIQTISSGKYPRPLELRR